ncbi:MAG: hypothetical protein ACKPKO_30495, partial [Candidatus Fonsibacter sp.]
GTRPIYRRAGSVSSGKKKQFWVGRAVPNATYDRYSVGRRHPQPQALASATELNISNIRH